MLIPYSTDAPVYYWPFATVGLIVANVVAFILVAVAQIIPADSWILSFGQGLHPAEWLLSIFMHADPMHLIGNMLFLWLFGLVVEGKIGWWRFLACYLAIGLTEQFLVQVVMLGYEGDSIGALGASGAIFGLMGMALIWAPKNEITFLFLSLWYRGEFEISIALMCGLYAGWEVIMICITGSDAGTSWLHLTGFVLGVPLAIVMLQRKIVDCEGWDAFSVWKGEAGALKDERPAKEVLAKADAARKEKDEELLRGAEQQFRTFLQQGNVVAALRLFEKMRPVRGGIVPRQKEWLAMIQSLHAEKRWADSAPYMASCIAAYPAEADGLRIKLAQICVVELQRPGRALDLLDDVKAVGLPEKHAEMAKRIKAKARQMQNEGVVELDDDAW